MQVTTKCLVVAALVFTAQKNVKAQVSPDPIVVTANGPLQGRLEKDVVLFQGVRYAQPPTGRLRWRAPQPLTRWKETQDATRFGPACSQLSVANKAEGKTTPEQSEDCLLLNLWIPAGLTASSQAPVMVYIFGGGFATGDASAADTNIEQWARHGVIAVGINYRLGYLGWFAHPELTKEAGPEGTGNFGLMDQIAALRWVHDNITVFGGNPGNVTMVGSSAGGVSINALMVSPPAQGLFAKAITLSGFGREASQTLAAAEKAGNAFAQRDGATNLEQLRALTIAQIMAVPPTPAGDPLSPDPTGPITGVASLPTDIFPAFMQGKEAHVPWMIGSNSFDGSNLFEGLHGNTGKLFAAFPPPIRAKLDPAFNPSGKFSQERVAGEVLTARVSNEPARALAASHAKHGQPTYLYYFDYVATGERQTIWGAPHGSEKAFIFDDFHALPNMPHYQPSSSDEAMAASVLAYLTNFAKTGDPNGSSLPVWRPGSQGTTFVFDDAGERSEENFMKLPLDLMEQQANQHPLP